MAYLHPFGIFTDLPRDLHMLMVFGPGSNILFVARNIIFRRNHAEKGLECGIVSLERFLQFCGRDHFAWMVELRREECG